MKIIVLLFTLLFMTSTYADNLHLIESKPNGFAIYRTGEPDADDMKQFCALGIQEMMVLSGDMAEYEGRYKSQCPTLKVISNLSQTSGKPVGRKFLQEFDQWVEQARTTGKKIAFRCSCGCHRTGRLAAYYQMKYMNDPIDKVLADMNKLGKRMWMHPELEPQVRSMKDFLANKPCSVESKYCVIGD